MTASNAYASLADLKLRIANYTGTSLDAVLDRNLEAASRMIDGFCGRRFYAPGTEARTFTAETPSLVMVDDIGTTGSVTVVVDADGDRTYETNFASTDFDLWPDNEGPYMEIRTTPAGVNVFPAGLAKGVKVTAYFGYQSSSSTSCPSDVYEACLIQAQRLYRRKDAPFGVVGSAEMGQALVIAKLDPDVQKLLEPYRRLV